MRLVEQARLFATAAHAAVKQVRKYTGEPYIIHPLEVMAIVETVPHTEEMLAAALLHDVVEDTGVTVVLIYTEFGPKVAELVQWLTDISKPEDGNRAVRKKLDREHSAAAPAEAQTVKLADLISNSRSIVRYDHGFAIKYLAEIEALLKVMIKGDPSLYEIAYQLVEEGRGIIAEARLQAALSRA